MQQKRERLDKMLVERGIVKSRSSARAKILAGEIIVDGFPVKKPASMVREDCSITLTGKDEEWASRGAYKLLRALDSFVVSVKGRRCVDIGASTGGFTDVMLQKGAEKVYAVDVGYGQLAWKLRKDPRVVVMERTNARNLSPESFEDVFLVTIDVSFISLRHILPVADRILDDRGFCIALVKPQFEAGRGKVGKKGVVRDRQVHEEVLRAICDFVHQETNFTVKGLEVSPILGPEGNREFLLYLEKGGGAGESNGQERCRENMNEIIAEKIEEAHSPGFFGGKKQQAEGGLRN